MNLAFIPICHYPKVEVLMTTTYLTLIDKLITQKWKKCEIIYKVR